MSVANDGISRFVESTVYAPVNFKGDVIASHVVAENIFTPLINAGAVPLVLSSESLVRLGGALAIQDYELPAGTYTLAIETLGFEQVYICSGAVNIVLPEIEGGGVGIPRGVRLRFLTSGAGVVRFKTTELSNAPIAYFVSSGNGAASVNTYAAVVANDYTNAYQPNSLINICSAKDAWVVQGTTYA